MGQETSDILFGILYASGAVLLLITSYILFLKRFKKSKLKAVSDVILTTSRYDNYNSKTQFLIELSDDMSVTLDLLDEKEEKIRTILSESMPCGENIVNFDPTDLKDGIYYLSLKTPNTNILRRITIGGNTDE